MQARPRGIRAAAHGSFLKNSGVCIAAATDFSVLLCALEDEGEEDEEGDGESWGAVAETPLANLIGGGFESIDVELLVALEDRRASLLIMTKAMHWAIVHFDVDKWSFVPRISGKLALPASIAGEICEIAAMDVVRCQPIDDRKALFGLLSVRPAKDNGAAMTPFAGFYLEKPKAQIDGGMEVDWSLRCMPSFLPVSECAWLRSSRSSLGPFTDLKFTGWEVEGQCGTELGVALVQQSTMSRYGSVHHPVLMHATLSLESTAIRLDWVAPHSSGSTEKVVLLPWTTRSCMCSRFASITSSSISLWNSKRRPFGSV